ncbi:MAG: 5-formyltetrahydrofolate cyclo-ligase [Clostridiales bacterium]|nr:5-formyltetrahydrofolate cyclo-ligase [Clostridiales bacterium]
MIDKMTIRKRILDNRDQLSNNQIKTKSNAILEQLIQMEAVRTASDLYTYVSFGSEVDTFGLIRWAFTNGKNVYVPRIISKGIINFYRIQSLGELVPGKFGILEPISEEVGNFGRRKDQVMILPGIAFDRDKNRIGYGGGYYDRYLEKYDQGISAKIAVGFELQMMDAIEPNEFDKKVDSIVTEDKIYE